MDTDWVESRDTLAVNSGRLAVGRAADYVAQFTQ